MKFSDIIFGSPNVSKDASLDHLVSEGFSREEAKMLAWLRMRMDLGKYLGLVGGLLLLASIRKGHKTPLPLFSKPISTRTIFGSIIGMYFVGNYLFNYNRRGSNTPIANFYTNNNLMANKFDLVQNFEPFNRKFTKDEVEQMIFNGKLKTLGRKSTYTILMYMVMTRLRSRKSTIFTIQESMLSLPRSKRTSESRTERKFSIMKL
jgi:hypothetical protein